MLVVFVVGCLFCNLLWCTKQLVGRMIIRMTIMTTMIMTIMTMIALTVTMTIMKKTRTMTIRIIGTITMMTIMR